MVKIKAKPCTECCNSGDCTPKLLKGKGLCDFHYKISRAKIKPLEIRKTKSGVTTPQSSTKFLYGAKKGQILDFTATKEVLETYTISQLRKVCDYWFRRYLIKVGGFEGKDFILCPLTGGRTKMENIHVCHYIDRARMILRYSEDNCVLCSAYTNTFEAHVKEEGFKSLHHKKFEDFLGAEKIEKLNNLSQEVVVYSKDDYINMINKFRT